MQNAPLSRHAIAVFPAVFLTVTLLYAMHMLITLKPFELVPPRDAAFVDWVRVREKQPPPPIEARAEPIPDPPPTPATRQKTGSGEEFAIGIPAGPMPPPGPGFGQRTELSLGDAALVIVMRVQPAYPSDAIVRQLEGFVTVEYDVGANGRTANHRIVESSHRVFEKSAIKAAEQFRYQPRTVDGEPTVTTGIRSRFRFELDAQ